MEYLQRSIEEEEALMDTPDKGVDSLAEQLVQLQEELKATKAQKVRDCLRHPENAEVIEETYDAMENELQTQITGVKNQLRMSSERENTVVQVERTAKTVLKVFDRILDAESISRADLSEYFAVIARCKPRQTAQPFRLN